MKRTIITASLLAAFVPATASAAKPEVENRRVSPALRAKHEKVQKANDRPRKRSSVELKRDTEQPSRYATGLLHAYRDGRYVLGIKVGAAMTRRLQAQGVRRAKSQAEVVERTLFQDRYYVAYDSVHSSELKAPEDALAESLVGREVRLELAKTKLGRYRVIGALRAESSK